MFTRSYKILFVTAEVAPLAKVGGLGDVSGALPKALKALGHDVRVIMPNYATINDARHPSDAVLEPSSIRVNDQELEFSVRQTALQGDVPVYLVDQPYYFGRNSIYGFADDSHRFAYFCLATLMAVRSLNWKPDIIHCNDWHTGLIPLWLKTAYAGDPFFSNIATLYTLHILAYQGRFPRSVLDGLGLGSTVPHADYINPMEQGILSADMVNTVSETYAREVMTPELGEGLHEVLQKRAEDFSGILNGIDYDVYNPATDPAIRVQYGIDSIERKRENKLALQHEFNLPAGPGIPLIGMVSRLAETKGLELVMAALEPLLQEVDMQLVVLGSGDQQYQDFFRQLAARYPHKLGIALGFNAALAQRIYAGSDLFLMPSRVEPCGLGQLIAMRYGTIPIVRETGGLADTVHNYMPENRRGNGFSFRNYTSFALTCAIIRALEHYRYKDEWCRLMVSAMQQDHSWSVSAQRYANLYMQARQAHTEPATLAAS